jgi:integrase/recombinase XerD
MSTKLLSHPIFPTDYRQIITLHQLACRTKNHSNNTLASYGRYNLRFCEYMISPNILDITPNILRTYFVHLSEKGHNPGGVHVHYRCIKALFNWYWGEYEPEAPNPFAKVKIPAPKIKPLPGVTIENVKHLIDACNTSQSKRDKAMLMFLLDTGVRASELAALNIADCDMITGSIYITDSKSDNSRTVFMGTVARRYLRRYLKTRSGINDMSPLFATDEGDRLDRWSMRHIINRRSKDAGIKSPGLHDFRRAFALNLLRNGTNLQIISRLLGHHSVAVTERYLAVDETDLQEGHRIGSPVDRIL